MVAAHDTQDNGTSDMSRPDRRENRDQLLTPSDTQRSPDQEAAQAQALSAGRGARDGGTVAGALAVVAATVALVLTWRRLFVGMDLQDESYYVLVPWRWALGDRPFVQEQNLLQLPGFLTYPFVKAFGVLRDYDVTGLMLYTRHLYLLLMIAVAAVAFLFLRRLVRWQLALPAACVVLTYIYWATPQLGYNTLALAFLTLSTSLAAWVVAARGRRALALASGVCLGIACVAYPTLLFVVPFWAILFAFAHGRRAVGMIAEGTFMHPPDPPGPPTGRSAWRGLSAWVLGGLIVLVPVGLLVLSYGPHNLVRAWHTTMSGAKVLHQLGGASKAVDIAQGVYRLVAWRPYMVVAALAIYLVYLRWPRVGRALLAGTPIALWLAAQRPLLWGGGYVIVYVLLAPYFYLFIPRELRVAGARLLICVWAPSIVAGAMTAYTSAAGYVNAAVGLAPSVVASGLFLSWALEAVGPGRRERPDGRAGRRRSRLRWAKMREGRRRRIVRRGARHGWPLRCWSPSSASLWHSSTSSNSGTCPCGS